jgi:hypothetical protein
MKEVNAIATNNGYNINDIKRSYEKHKNIICTDTSPVETKTWKKFTYFGSDIRTLTKIFKNSILKVSFNVNNTIKIRCKSTEQFDKYKNNGVYQLKCLSCELGLYMMKFFWVWTSCGLAGRSQRFGEAYCLHRSDW